MLGNIIPLIRCPNQKCTSFGVETEQRIIRYGKTQRGYQKYLCLFCKKTFIETQRTHLYDIRLPKDEIIKICRLLIDKNSFRSIKKKTNHHRDTIRNLSLALLADPKSAEKIIFHSINVNKSNIDDMWNTIIKNIKIAEFKERD
jgi:transposase-like protein